MFNIYDMSFRDREFRTVLDMETITSKASVLSQLNAQCAKSGSGMFIAQGIEEKVLYSPP